MRRHRRSTSSAYRGANVDKYDVELDAGRAAQSAASGITTIHSNLFETIGKAESVSFLYLNPPYDSEIGSAGNKRMEYLFLEHMFRCRSRVAFC